MKNIRYLFLCGLLMSLTGCYDSVVRFWNGDGYYPPPAKKQAYHECSQAFDKINPPPTPPISPEVAHSEASRRRTDELYEYINKCLREKGY
ncbi:hypothetical protein PT286_09160 [Neisseriaceae bacterium ESL0693]|nr:hypothetical protein [Neisseriaceae bacterium ESL0693]